MKNYANENLNNYSFGQASKIARKVLEATLLCSIFFLGAMNLQAQTSSTAKDYAGTSALASHDLPPVLTPPERLLFTYADTLGAFVNAGCGVAACTAPPANIFNENIVCNGALNKTCTYDIQIAGQVKTGGNTFFAGENGLYQILVDGAIPTGGGTDANGFYSWQLMGPEFYHGTSYNVHSQVKNTVVANQKHNIQVNLSCVEVLGDGTGCFAQSDFQTLDVRVLIP